MRACNSLLCIFYYRKCAAGQILVLKYLARTFNYGFLNRRSARVYEGHFIEWEALNVFSYEWYFLTLFLDLYNWIHSNYNAVHACSFRDWKTLSIHTFSDTQYIKNFHIAESRFIWAGLTGLRSRIGYCWRLENFYY